MESFDIVVVGGGYAGVLAALRAQQGLGGGRVGLVSTEGSLVERTRLHEAAVRGVSVRTKLRELLGPAIPVIVGRARRVGGGRVELEGGQILEARRVIVATGTRMVARVPGAEVLEPEGIERLHARIAALPSDATVAVIGGGLTGIELAGELAEAGHRTVLVTPGALGGADLSAEAASACAAALEALGVERITARALRAEQGELWIDRGAGPEPIGAALSIATTGMSARGPFDELELRGPTLEVARDPTVLLAGDCAASAVGVRTGCKTAMPLGAHAGDNAVRSLRGQALVPFSWRFYGSCVSVGRARGVVELWPEGRARPLVVFTGRLGAWLKEQVLRYTLGSMHLQRRGLLHYRWPSAGPSLLPAEAT